MSGRSFSMLSVTTYLKRVVGSFGASVRLAIRAQPRTFLIAFGVLTVVTFVYHVRYPLGPGQDYHYHLMVASIYARPSGDAIRSLYGSINPFDANTLIYTLAYPWEKIADPARAFQLAVTCTTFIGLPLACAIALIRLGRSPWGSLLAFPMAYSPTWADGGFMTFLSAAPFFVIAIAETQLAHDATTAKKVRAHGILGAFACFLTFLAHGHVYMWLGILLGTLTLIRLIKELAALPFDPRAALSSAFSVGVRSLAIITPSLLAFTRWYFTRHGGANAAASNQTWASSDAPWGDKLTAIFSLMSFTKGEHEAKYLVVLGLVVAFCMMAATRNKGRLRGFGVETCFLLSVLSIFLLPVDFNGQTISRRHIDLSMWLLPLVVFVPSERKLRGIERVAAAALFVFSVARVEYIGRHMKLLNEEDYRGLREAAAKCKKVVDRSRNPELAYASMGFMSKHIVARSLHQAHETFAAVCGIDTPVYPPNKYPNNLLPLRYRTSLPAPITIMTGNSSWYAYPGLWTSFEYVLVQGWTVTPTEAQRLVPQAELVVEAGDFQLWHRR